MRRSWRLKNIIAVIPVWVAASTAYAVDCASPVVPEGALQWFASGTTVKFCSAGTWLDTDKGNVSGGATCSTAGQIEYDPAVGQKTYRFCNGTNWRTMKGSNLGTCPAGNVGITSYNFGTAKYSFCDGAILWDMTPGVACTPVVLTSGTSWNLPAHWNNAANSIQVIGGGGGGGDNATASAGGAGGGGGAYSAVTNQTLTGPSVTYKIGAGGGQNTAGGETYFCNTSSNCTSILGSAVIAAAEGGQGAVTNTPGTGADLSSAVGVIKNTGGSGMTGNGVKGGGAGGAGGSAGSGGTATAQVGAVGDNNTGGTGGAAGGAGGAGSELNGAGAGGGGGGGNANTNGGAGGNYGGGGGGAGKNNGRTGGTGGGGVVIINYTSLSTCP